MDMATIFGVDATYISRVRFTHCRRQRAAEDMEEKPMTNATVYKAEEAALLYQGLDPGLQGTRLVGLVQEFYNEFPVEELPGPYMAEFAARSADYTERLYRLSGMI
jgi:hypothetical protein